MASKSPTLAARPKASAARISFEEFLSTDYGDGCVEWVDGEVVVMPPPSTQHARVTRFVFSLINRFVEAHGIGEVFFEPYLMKMDVSGRCPDILSLANENAPRIQANYLDGPADLAVEVVSPDSRTRDRAEKYYEYEKAGVREYWLIDPTRSVAEFYVLGDANVYASVPVDSDGLYSSRVLDGLRIKPAWIWQDPLPAVPSLLAEAGI